jgi:hypothetical protein
MPFAHAGIADRPALQTGLVVRPARQLTLHLCIPYFWIYIALGVVFQEAGNATPLPTLDICAWFACLVLYVTGRSCGVAPSCAYPGTVQYGVLGLRALLPYRQRVFVSTYSLADARSSCFQHGRGGRGSQRCVMRQQQQRQLSRITVWWWVGLGLVGC